MRMTGVTLGANTDDPHPRHTEWSVRWNDVMLCRRDHAHSTRVPLDPAGNACTGMLASDASVLQAKGQGTATGKVL
jgi:hypothetical protein